LINVNWQPLAWDKRQMKSDQDATNADRQRRYREKKKSNDDGNALHNGDVTPLEKKREEKKRKDNTVKFDVFWSVYPKRVAKQDAIRAWGKLNDKDKDDAIAGVGRFVDGKEIRYVCNPATYINGKRWNDEVSVTVEQRDMRPRI
jgi:hypothetical protein